MWLFLLPTLKHDQAIDCIRQPILATVLIQLLLLGLSCTAHAISTDINSFFFLGHSTSVAINLDVNGFFTLKFPTLEKIIPLWPALFFVRIWLVYNSVWALGDPYWGLINFLFDVKLS